MNYNEILKQSLDNISCDKCKYVDFCNMYDEDGNKNPLGSCEWEDIELAAYDRAMDDLYDRMRGK